MSNKWRCQERIPVEQRNEAMKYNTRFFIYKKPSKRASTRKFLILRVHFPYSSTKSFLIVS